MFCKTLKLYPWNVLWIYVTYLLNLFHVRDSTNSSYIHHNKNWDCVCGLIYYPGLFDRISLTVMFRFILILNYTRRGGGGNRENILGLGMLECGYAWLQMFMVGHFPIFPQLIHFTDCLKYRPSYTHKYSLNEQLMNVIVRTFGP